MMDWEEKAMASANQLIVLLKSRIEGDDEQYNSIPMQLAP